MCAARGLNTIRPTRRRKCCWSKYLQPFVRDDASVGCAKHSFLPKCCVVVFETAAKKTLSWAGWCPDPDLSRGTTRQPIRHISGVVHTCAALLPSRPSRVFCLCCKHCSGPPSRLAIPTLPLSRPASRGCPFGRCRSPSTQLGPQVSEPCPQAFLPRAQSS